MARTERVRRVGKSAVAETVTLDLLAQGFLAPRVQLESKASLENPGPLGSKGCKVFRVYRAWRVAGAVLVLADPGVAKDREVRVDNGQSV